MSEYPDIDDFAREPELDVFAWFERHEIKHQTLTHAPTFTVEDSAKVKTDIVGGQTKNLFLKDKKGNLILVSAWAHSELPLNQLHKVIGTQRLSFTKADRLWEHLKVTPGSVSAFALIHDHEQQVRFIVDSVLLDFDNVNFHPLRCDMTTSLTISDFRRFIQSTRRELEVVDFSSLKG